ncbi:four helix bundle protein [Patescibacteria group bacterium]|nr:four helix bundle protein [Patescibacteria group bacterium]
MDKNKIKSFTDLFAWQEGHKLVLTIYQIINKFPKSESYALADQMRRCVVSITSNIAEGFSRSGKKEKIQFYFISLGSITELQNQLLITRDLGYIKDAQFREIADKTVTVQKLLNGLISSIKRCNF